MIPVEAVAFVNPAKRDQWEANHRLVQHADLREHVVQIFRDAKKRTVGV